MKTAIITALTVSFLLGGCAKQYTEPVVSFEDEAQQDEYEIYSLSVQHVYLRNLLSHNKNPIEMIVIIKETNDLGEYWIEKFSEEARRRNVSEEAVEDWVAENQSIKRLQRKFKFSYDYDLVPRDELDKFDADNFFEEFYKKYPDSNGLISVSRIGFDGKKTTALVHVIHSYGTLGANYYFIVLKKTDDIWGIAERITTSLS
jgi:hypothetical protein